MKQVLYDVKARLRRGKGPSYATRLQMPIPVERHGTDYGGWCILPDSLSPSSVVYSFGIGEDISFDLSLIQHYGCTVHGFDPTPRAIEFVKRQTLPLFVLHEYGLGAETGDVTFFLPQNPKHVSGAALPASHLQADGIQVPLKCLPDILKELGHPRVDLLKMDIEGAEYSVIDALEHDDTAARVNQWLIEFHHRFYPEGAACTDRAIQQLKNMGFELNWVSPREEEFLFTQVGTLHGLGYLLQTG